MQQQLAVPDSVCFLLSLQELRVRASTEARPSCEAVITAGRPSWLLIAPLLLGCGHAAGRHWPLSLTQWSLYRCKAVREIGGPHSL